jgi:hypothetical protein
MMRKAMERLHFIGFTPPARSTASLVQLMAQSSPLTEVGPPRRLRGLHARIGVTLGLVLSLVLAGGMSEAAKRHVLLLSLSHVDTLLRGIRAVLGGHAVFNGNHFLELH